MAGWQGVFAIEKDKHAFESLSWNLISGGAGHKYKWPVWLPKKNLRIGAFIKRYRKQIANLKGQVDLLVGGPPCQGFSMAGKRRKSDPRNLMFRHYIEVVSLIRPSIVVLENVRGIDIKFKQGKTQKKVTSKNSKAFSMRIMDSLRQIGYEPHSGIIDAKNFGVPQTRSRYFIFAFDTKYLNDVDRTLLGQSGRLNPFELLKSTRAGFLSRRGLQTDRPVTVREALSDLTTRQKRLIECVDSSGFRQVVYARPYTSYQKLLHGKMNGVPPNSMRLVNHRDETIERFEVILKTCRRGVLLSQEDRKRLGMKKHATVPLDGKRPSHTLTTLPDDILHYSEPRILTVRESARLQSFPDQFEFKGKYTTGSKQRVKECPRYTQVGNAVPPLVAEIIGLVLMRIMVEIAKRRRSQPRRKHLYPGRRSR